MSKVDTSGTWTAISVTPPSLEGLNTSHVTWGVPAESRKSGYVFTGGTVEALLDGTEFALGTITHQNYPITGISTGPSTRS
ncbi:choice-of-anchor K domain-containing protein [Streptomyces beigongshangae]|uniref:choice-of-anchor K domain-containing protein n=1 Tax=Streptomyces beigongshangae TaxID=2841597 RepID=UPI001C866394|nr:choice-of-anchor K domain-containing protein [Streptomyces sp. REN17]